MVVLFWLGILVLLVQGGIALEVIAGNRRISSLDKVPADGAETFPRVSVVTAARNEARHVGEGVRSLLALDYPDLEIIVVNDRSEDETGEILAHLARQDARLQVLTVARLPAGWLGKNHALWVGSRHARGELLLFTDADVVMDASLLRRAVYYLREQSLDHLAVTPRLALPGLLLPAFGLAFAFFFSLYARPWKVTDPRSSSHIGIGAFNLVRARAYREVGGHQPIRLRPDDDMKLGKILKQQGFRQGVANGSGLMAVEWYGSLGEAVRGLEKNIFAGCGYRLSVVAAGIVFNLAFNIWPYVAVVAVPGTARWFYGGALLLLTGVLVDCARRYGTRVSYALGFPLAAVLFVGIVLRTVTLNLIHGGITWRGTFYPLSALKANKV